ncbi:hypothetical protein H5410_019265 [Solanum commersonii]|uniref:Uncharacterized protein n=1 Tax=Solanum commersonii TaxID=4109 RepID=A0A9J6A4H3_SOLCO|nr:hypothetical protein H5410_019265 [Solanum commersonii]
MWNKAASCIREVASKVLGVSRVTLEAIKEIGGGMGKSKAKWRRRRPLIEWVECVSEKVKRLGKFIRDKDVS